MKLQKITNEFAWDATLRGIYWDVCGLQVWSYCTWIYRFESIIERTWRSVIVMKLSYAVQLSHHEHLQAMMVRAFVDIRFHPDQHERLISIHWRRNKHAYMKLISHVIPWNDGAISSNLSVHVAIRECEGFIDDRLRVAQTWRRACLVFFSRDWISGTHMCLGIS